MNKTKIEWCDMTWNPVTGCFHECEYCYARKIAQRFGGHMDMDYFADHTEANIQHGDKAIHDLEHPLVIYRSEAQKAPFPFGFAPTLHRYRLDEPIKIKNPQTIFVCSMADLFGDWVPDEWIHEVFKACERAPQHRHLFLTKNPKRYKGLYEAKALPYADNYWFGTTVAKARDEYAWFRETPYKCFLSIEPMLEPLGDLEYGQWPDWIIIGAETGNRKGKVIPKREWIESIVRQCRVNSVPVFMKDSLRDLMVDDFVQEFPWEVHHDK